MIEKHTLAPAAPAVDVIVTPSDEAPGMYAVAFSWEPGSDVAVDHYQVVLTERPILLSPDRTHHRPHWAEVTNRSGWVSWLVHPGDGLWVSVTAVGTDGARSAPELLGVDAVAS